MTAISESSTTNAMKDLGVLKPTTEVERRRFKPPCNGSKSLVAKSGVSIVGKLQFVRLAPGSPAEGAPS